MPATARHPLILLALLWLIGGSMRMTILAVPPVLPLIKGDLHLTGTEVGILGGLPVAMFALAAIPGSLLIARLGARRAGICALLIVALGTALRLFAFDAPALFAATILMGAGVGILQPTTPALVREWLPDRVGFATAIYSNGLLIGELVPVWVAPVLMAVEPGWRAVIASWAIPAVAVAALVALLAPPPIRAASPTAPARWWPDWKDPMLWGLAAVLGSVNASYFATNAFVPGLLTWEGHAEAIQPALVAVNAGQLPGSFLFLLLVRQLERRAWPFMLAGGLLFISVVGIVFGGSGPVIVASSALLGAACAFGLILGLTLPALLAGPGDVGRLSAATFTISYGWAMFTAFIGGVLWDVTGLPAMAFLPVGLCTVITPTAAWWMQRRGYLR